MVQQVTHNMPYTAEEKKILSQYFTDTEDTIFALINLPEVIKGTLFSRYSRTAKDLRRLFIDEFVKEENLKSFFKKNKTQNTSLLDIERADDFYERILVGYGDDSVAELGGVHVAVEAISMLGTKSIEEHRLGLSPLEKSTRYVYFDKKIDGEYMYFKDPTIMKSKYKKLYIETNEMLFDAYSKIVRDLQPILKKVYPGDETDTAYKFSIRAKACDLARGLLPLSTRTNMGVYGNGRAFEYLLTHLFNDPLMEVRDVAKRLNANLSKVVAAFIRRATNQRGIQYREYLTATSDDIAKYVRKNMKGNSKEKVKGLQVTLVDYDPQTIEKVIAAALYTYSQKSFKEALSAAKKLSKKEKESFFKKALQQRINRHHKPMRQFEEPYFSFEVIADWGVYKDLMRHRILTRHHQLFTNELGYYTPEELTTGELGKLYKKAMDQAVIAYKKVKKDFPHQAQYFVTHGSYNRFYMRMNLREVMHMTELRASPQGHPTYRKVAQHMATLVSKQFPILKKYAFPFVDYKDYELERLSAFRKIAQKAEELGMKKVFEE